MSTTVTLSDRGQVTLPAEVCKQLGLKPGDALVVKTTEAGVVLRPAMVMPYDIYSESSIARWDKEDEWAHQERAELEKALKQHSHR